MFCPECGTALAEKPQADNSPSEVDKKPPAEESSAASSAEPQPTAPIETGHTDPVEHETKANGQPAYSSGPGKVERTREKLQQVSTAARGALEQNVKRADKIRHVSSAMLEEASYDPSLRFVLVALGLFGVFLLLLVLSKVME